MELKISKNDVISMILSFLKHEHERTVKVFSLYFPGVPDRSTLQLFIVPDYLLERSMIVPEHSMIVP
jgi:hypothetical protein